MACSGYTWSWGKNKQLFMFIYLILCFIYFCFCVFHVCGVRPSNASRPKTALQGPNLTPFSPQSLLSAQRQGSPHCDCLPIHLGGIFGQPDQARAFFQGWQSGGRVPHFDQNSSKFWPFRRKGQFFGPVDLFGKIFLTQLAPFYFNRPLVSTSGSS